MARARSARRRSLHSIYFDTSDRRLRDLNISLRTRSDGNAIVQTIKMAGCESDPVSRREWETLVHDPVPDPSLLIDPALPPAFRKLTSADLLPVFDVDVNRDTRCLETDGARIELSLDEGTVTAGQQREEVHEIELELVSGSLERLFAEARRMSDVVDGRLHARTKSDLGYALTREARKHWSRASRLCLAADMTAGEAFQLIVRNSFAQLTANDDCARLNLHPEGVHQCRIALRRLRSAFKIFSAPIRRKRVEPIEDEVRWLGKVLGSARDLDVLQADLLEPAIEALGESEQAGAARLRLADEKGRRLCGGRRGARLRALPALLIDLCAFGHGDYHDLAKSEDTGLDQPLRHFAARLPSAGASEAPEARPQFRDAVEDGTPRRPHRAQADALRGRFLRRRVRSRAQHSKFFKKPRPAAGRPGSHERRRDRGGHAGAPHRRCPGRRLRAARSSRPIRASWPLRPAACWAGTGDGLRKSIRDWSRIGVRSTRAKPFWLQEQSAE